MLVCLYPLTFIQDFSEDIEFYEWYDSTECKGGLGKRPIGEVLVIDLQDPIPYAEPPISVCAPLGEYVVNDENTLEVSVEGKVNILELLNNGQVGIKHLVHGREKCIIGVLYLEIILYSKCRERETFIPSSKVRLYMVEVLLTGVYILSVQTRWICVLTRGVSESACELAPRACMWCLPSANTDVSLACPIVCT